MSEPKKRWLFPTAPHQGFKNNNVYVEQGT